jgi:hypothetical protein
MTARDDTPLARFENLARRLLSVPKTEVDAAEAARKKRKSRSQKRESGP